MELVGSGFGDHLDLGAAVSAVDCGEIVGDHAVALRCVRRLCPARSADSLRQFSNPARATVSDRTAIFFRSDLELVASL